MNIWILLLNSTFHYVHNIHTFNYVFLDTTYLWSLLNFLCQWMIANYENLVNIFKQNMRQYLENLKDYEDPFHADAFSLFLT